MHIFVYVNKGKDTECLCIDIYRSTSVNIVDQPAMALCLKRHSKIVFENENNVLIEYLNLN
jgi:hypothetical protein